MPEVTLSLALVVVGFVMLIIGGDALVRAAVVLAGCLRISPLVIGVTVVAFGTSAPELAVTLQSAWVDAADLAVGNIVGSNIANILLVLGIAAVMVPLVVPRRVIRVDLALVSASSIGVWWLSFDGRLGFVDGLGLCAALIVYLVWSLRQGRREGQTLQEQGPAVDAPSCRAGRLGMESARLLFGLLMLALGARVLVMGAVDVAYVFGIGELAVGLTVVAIGTSLPEVVTSVVAALRGQRDLALGNVIGSNLFNLLAVLGLGALLSPQGIPVSHEARVVDLPLMIATVLLCRPVCVTGWRISRFEGALLLALFAAYLTEVLLRATHHPARELFTWVMLFGVIPWILATFALALRRQRRERDDTDPEAARPADPAARAVADSAAGAPDL